MEPALGSRCHPRPAIIALSEGWRGWLTGPLGTVDAVQLVDVIILVLALGFAVGGYRQGFVTAVLSFVGLVGGAALGLQLAEPLSDPLDSADARFTVAVLVVVVTALLGQVGAVTVGSALRRRITNGPSRTVDSVLGALISVITVIGVAWMVATPLASSTYPSVAADIRKSEIIGAVDKRMPGPVRKLYTSLREAVDDSRFPEVFGRLSPTIVRDVPSPDPDLVDDPAVVRAAPSIVKVSGTAASCSKRIEGSGFVYAAERVMTNAHVVAGVEDPTVIVDGEQVDSTVVYFDADVDIAVLYAPDLDAAPLQFADTPADSGDDAIVAGYPESGPFYVGSARIRAKQDISGPNIYDDKTVDREIYSLRALVRPGNSGGPLLAPGGSVFGVVFAAAVDRDDTGFALTGRQVAPAATEGETAVDEVDTGECTEE